LTTRLAGALPAGISSTTVRGTERLATHTAGVSFRSMTPAITIGAIPTDARIMACRLIRATLRPDLAARGVLTLL
jgi:hypothetical protein